MRMKMRIARELRYGDKEITAYVRVILSNPDPRVRADMIEVLLSEGRMSDEVVSRSTTDRSADIRALAARSVPPNRIHLSSMASSDPSPLVRAEALRRLADPAAKDVLLKALESDDPFIQQAAREGLRRSLSLPELLRLAGDPKPAHRLGALLILRDSGRPEASEVVQQFLGDPDPAIHFAAIQWVGEQRLSRYRPQLMEGLASGKVSRDGFEGTLAAIDMLHGKKRDPHEEVAGEDFIAALLVDSRTPAAVQRRGLRLLRPDHPVLTLALIRRFLAHPEEPVRLEAVRTLCASSLPQRFDILGDIADDRRSPVPLRAQAIVGLADDATNQRDRLIALAECGPPVLRREAIRSLRGVALSEGERKRLENAARGDEESGTLISTLQGNGAGANAHGTPTSRTAAERSLPPNSDLATWLARLEGPADAEAGGRLFFHPRGPGCNRCHQVDGRGGRSGPDLTTLSASMDRRRLVQSILQPSLEVAPQFVAWAVAKTDGTVFTGVLVGEAPDGTQTFADSEGRLITVKSSDIEDRKPQPSSIMPDNVSRTLTLQEFRDLLAFLLNSGQ
jgi:putative heme-binding domain-containing protein